MRRKDREATRAAGRARWLAGVLLLGWTVLLGACREAETASGTALYVTAEFDSALLLTQLEVSGTVRDDGPVGPTRLPAQPDRFLHSGETFRVLLPSASDGTLAELRVQGLRDGQPQAYGTGSVQVRAGREVDVTVRLVAHSATGDGGTPDGGGGTPDGGGGTPDGGGGTPDGGGGNPDAGFCPDCAGGCCLNGYCTTPGFNTCGSGGVACVRCDINTADTCLSQGVCGCGSGPACTWAGVDRCTQGQCQCGSGAACGPGQQCVNGECRCTTASCNGCCDGNVCQPGTERNQCGSDGQACRRCNKRCNADGTCD